MIPHKKIMLNGVPIDWYDIDRFKVEHPDKGTGRVEVYLCDGTHQQYENVNLKDFKEQIDMIIQKARTK